MGSMPEVISKEPIFGKLDTVLNNKANRPQVKTDLESGTPLLTLAGPGPGNYDFLNTAERNHINTHWFNNPSWLSGQVESVMREGLIAALEWAMNPASGGSSTTAGAPLPIPRQADIACYWICHPGHGGAAPPGGGSRHDLPEPLEVSISWNGHQVTVLFHTPEPDWPTTPTPNFEDSVVVKEVPGVERVRVAIELPQ